ncbi:T-cell surface antigen CD2-like [Haplochromis burtoni]|uniref:T-cell surface antigen CD2-like n=1 Tax=Haplochromis burtoni TaxID=8153 RepID=UPI001C2CC6CA|nr:T-cell surface antigen CD2-like [Haplochromis burtoni]
MIFIYISIPILATTALAKGSVECIFSESPGTHYCFGAVGQSLIFHLSHKIDTTMGVMKDNKNWVVKTHNNGAMILNHEYVNQPNGINNGTLKLGKAMKKHSGYYQLEEHDSNGKLLKKANVSLKIYAPVSKPTLSQMCLSPEQMKISCFSEGDGVQLILSLDGQILIQSNDHNQSLTIWTAEFPNVTIILDGKLTGNLMCQVWNNVSRDETVIPLAACSGRIFKRSVTTLTVPLVTNVIMLFVVLILVIEHFCKKARPTTVNEGNFGTDVI